jgi:hypothetical protein
MARIFLLLPLLVVCTSSVVAAEQVPLDKAWGVNIPGTRDARELEPRTEGDRHKNGPLMRIIYRELLEYYGRRGRVDAGHAFVVPGKGIAALNYAYDVLLQSEERPEVVPAGEVSLVFYARRSGQDVHLEKIEREGMVIKLQYRFVIRRSRQTTGHFALIPLGKLASGNYEVRIDQLSLRYPDDEHGPVVRPPLEEKIETQIISQPFSFEVE